MVAYAKSPKVTPAEYLELESSAETKSEYFDGVIVAMAGSTEEHDRAIGDIDVSIGAQLRGTRCEFFTGNMRVNVTDCNCSNAAMRIMEQQARYDEGSAPGEHISEMEHGTDSLAEVTGSVSLS